VLFLGFGTVATNESAFRAGFQHSGGSRSSCERVAASASSSSAAAAAASASASASAAAAGGAAGGLAARHCPSNDHDTRADPGPLKRHKCR